MLALWAWISLPANREYECLRHLWASLRYSVCSWAELLCQYPELCGQPGRQSGGPFTPRDSRRTWFPTSSPLAHKRQSSPLPSCFHSPRSSRASTLNHLAASNPSDPRTLGGKLDLTCKLFAFHTDALFLLLFSGNFPRVGRYLISSNLF